MDNDSRNLGAGRTGGTGAGGDLGGSESGRLEGDRGLSGMPGGQGAGMGASAGGSTYGDTGFGGGTTGAGDTMDRPGAGRGTVRSVLTTDRDGLLDDDFDWDDGESRGLRERSIQGARDLADTARSNPLGTLVVALGTGLLLQKSGLMSNVVSGALRSSPSPDNLTEEEERLLAWLNDAYALEKAQIPVLENHANDARDLFPDVRRRDLEHLEQTKRHAKLVKECIAHLGAKPSKVKSAMGRIGGAMNAMTTEPFDDEVVRNFLQDYAAENLEIISYEAIIAAAEEAGHPKIVRICEEILEEEEEMVEWLRDNLPRVVRTTLRRL
jgi:ferritin-like metal-binding protein YciE